MRRIPITRYGDKKSLIKRLNNFLKNRLAPASDSIQTPESIDVLDGAESTILPQYPPDQISESQFNSTIASSPSPVESTA